MATRQGKALGARRRGCSKRHIFIGGVHLIGIGVLGEYLGRVYMETKSRPIYIIRKKFSKRHA